jgi:quaternary ammonium compound-resistance protein SugE
MSWFILFIAGLFEICWVIGLKLSYGFSNLGWSIFTVISMVLSMGFLAYSLKTLPIGTAYAVWTGIGVVGATILGIIIFNESRDIVRIIFIFLIITGIIGLRFYTPIS